MASSQQHALCGGGGRVGQEAWCPNQPEDKEVLHRQMPSESIHMPVQRNSVVRSKPAFPFEFCRRSLNSVHRSLDANYCIGGISLIAWHQQGLKRKSRSGRVCVAKCESIAARGAAELDSPARICWHLAESVRARTRVRLHISWLGEGPYFNWKWALLQQDARFLAFPGYWSQVVDLG